MGLLQQRLDQQHGQMCAHRELVMCRVGLEAQASGGARVGLYFNYPSLIPGARYIFFRAISHEMNIFIAL